MSWIWLTARDNYFRALKNQLALLLPPRKGWKVKATAWCFNPCESFKPCALPLPSLLSQLEQQAGFPRISPLVPHPSLSPFLCSSFSSGRSNLGSAQMWTSFLEQRIKVCQHCWMLLCYLWENISTETWVTPVYAALNPSLTLKHILNRLSSSRLAGFKHMLNCCLELH